MTFIFLIFLAAFSLEAIGTIISVSGLSQLFGSSYLIMALAINFDIAKLVAVTALYKEWSGFPKKLRGYLTLACAVLVLITSAGAVGFLSAESQKALLPTKSIEVKVNAMKEEKQKLEVRKKEIDAQIANLPADMVKGRTKLMAGFKAEIEHANARTIELDTELPKLQVEMLDKSSHAGPITYIATAFNTTPEAAMGWVIGLIIFVFDPLAVSLILVGNYFLDKKSPKPEKDEAADLFEKIDNSSEYTIEKAWEAFGNLKPTAPVDWTLQPEYEREYNEEPEENPLVDDEDDADELYRDITSIPYIDDHAEESNMYPYFTPDFEEEIAQSSLTDIKTANTDVVFVDETSAKSDHFYK